ncbi:MAG: ABC transporter permease [Planctomycetes bacterium]|nr:ABC transporter permease [Planctomycetota bacterium]
MDRLLRGLLALNAVSAYAFLYLPIAVLILFSFSASRYASVWGGFSFRWYIHLFRDSAVRDALANSLFIAGLASVLATVMGTLLALGLERRRGHRHAARWDAAVTLPILIPDIVQGISLLLFFVLSFSALERLLGWRPTLGRTTVILAHTAFAISYVAVVVRARLAGMSRTLEEAAMDLGATEWQVLHRVTLPLVWPGVLGGGLLAFTLSLDEFVITFFTTGPGATTLPIQVWSMVRRGVTPEINALSSLILILSIVLVTLSLAVQRKR